jgi:copper chaperone CopZ
MKFNRLINGFLILVAAVFLTALGFHIRTGATADSVAVLKTSGMTCGSCSQTITKTLESLKGVAATEVDVEGGWVIVGYDTKSIRPEDLAEKVTVSGFGSKIHQLLTPEQFRQITGRELGKAAGSGSGCCSGKSGRCGSAKQS